MLFATWGEVQDYVDYDLDGRDLLPLVEVIDEHGVDVVLDTLGRGRLRRHRLYRPCRQRPRMIHRAHRRRLHQPLDEDTCNAAGNAQPAPIDPAEANLAFVAVTRARHRLDLGGLSWINRRPDGNPAHKIRA